MRLPEPCPNIFTSASSVKAASSNPALPPTPAPTCTVRYVTSSIAPHYQPRFKRRVGLKVTERGASITFVDLKFKLWLLLRRISPLSGSPWNKDLMSPKWIFGVPHGYACRYVGLHQVYVHTFSGGAPSRGRRPPGQGASMQHLTSLPHRKPCVVKIAEHM